VVVPSEVPVITGVSMDGTYLTETVSHIHLRDVVIGQLNARGADFRDVAFDGDCAVASLIADQGTVPSLRLPLPAILALPGVTYYDPEEIAGWLNRQARAFGARPTIPVYELLAEFAPFALVAKIARYKPFWLKDSDEKSARKILDDPYWDLVKTLLEKHDLIVERLDVPASGRPAPFYHIKNRAALMDLTNPPESLWPFLNDLFSASLVVERDRLRNE